jgi:hypothetical protein
MQKYIFLIPLFLFACKKNNSNPRIFTRQQPSKITKYAYDTATGIENKAYDITLHYNFGKERYDSIRFGQTRNFSFDYTRFASDYIVKADYSDIPNTYDQLFFDIQKNALTKYTTMGSPADDSTLLQYDSISRINKIQYFTSPSFLNFTISYNYKYDTIFQYKRDEDSYCSSSDTILLTIKRFNNQLPYLLLLNFNTKCNILIPTGLLYAFPISTNNYYIPRKVINGEINVTYTYTADSKGRLASLTTSTINTSTLKIISQERFVFEY